MKKQLLTLGCLIAMGTCQFANANTFTLNSVDGLINDGNMKSTFFETSPSDGQSGTASGLYSTTFGGTGAAGYSVTISFGSNPQPFLTSAFLKAGNFHLLWDSADLAAFNAGTFDSITLMNSGAGGIKNPPGNAYLGTSHAGFNGEPSNRVPDAGSTMALLGMGLTGLGLISRRKA